MTSGISLFLEAGCCCSYFFSFFRKNDGDFNGDRKEGFDDDDDDDDDEEDDDEADPLNEKNEDFDPDPASFFVLLEGRSSNFNAEWIDGGGSPINQDETTLPLFNIFFL
eukprot:TRINITY_DN5015_c0_g1_i2.p4 TRINITY_DN5015_c0_g1~~TRINITY_DN5015_c0_g1_i2.p4  ORF type:complete len:109 (-),score=36.69 TRINITY_DN5015_c0_g1_i2:588-914(-)